MCIVFLTGCKSNEKVSTSNITPPVTPNNATSKNASPTSKVSELQPTSTDKATSKNVKVRLYFLAMSELKYYYIDKIIPVEDNALSAALTKELQSTSYNKDFLSLTDKVKVKSAKIDEKTGVLKVVFSDSYVDHMTLGSNTEAGILTCLLATYGYNYGVKKVAIYFKDELYTSLKGELPEGYFDVNYPSAEAYNSSNNQSKPATTMTYLITTEVYTDKSAKINYPQLTNLGDDKRMRTINELIRKDILESYYQGAEEGMTLDIDYTIKLEEANLLSIHYLGLKNLQGASYPNNVLYTTNIDINKGSKLKLADLVIINKNLVDRCKNGNYIAWEGDASSEDGKALKAAVVESVNQIDPNDLSKYLNESDEISEKNSSGTFSYLTKDAIGISVQIPHAIGDHAEFEIKYKDITDNLKTGNGTV